MRIPDRVHKDPVIQRLLDYLARPIPFFSVYQTTPQTITTNTVTNVNYDTLSSAGNSQFLIDLANDTYTVQVPGIYLVGQVACWDTVAVAFQRFAAVTVNGGTFWYAQQRDLGGAPAAGDSGVASNGTSLIKLQRGDVLRSVVYHERGSNFNLRAGTSDASNLWAVYQGN